jgi:hypothetical protein
VKSPHPHRLTCLLVCATLVARGDLIFSVTTLDAALSPDDGYLAAAVTVNLAPDVLGPADGVAWGATGVGLARLWNSEWAGFDTSSANGTSLDSELEFATGYLEFTVSAAPGFKLHLTALDFGVAVGGTGTRSFQLYGAVNGTPILFSDPVLSQSPVIPETGTRGSPRPVSVDLTGTGYQEIDSLTLRWYPLTPAAGNTMGFNGFQLHGTVQAVVPEASTAGLVSLGLLGLRRMIRHRRP